ncbi:MAG: hypothetical protein DMF60_04650 [Acidobacteria bacterium]|nr:MAG: hypothetical protein DMF60_04650 [Acidobacteriota bacterium]
MRNLQRPVSVLLSIFLLSEFALAKTNIKDWNNVRILEPGSTIVVKTKQGEKYEGTLDVATVNSLSVIVTIPRVMRRVIDLRRDEIKEVRTKLPRFASTAIGAGVGLGIGIGLGAIADSKDKAGEDPGLGKLTFGFTGVLLGSVFGGAVGFGSKKIYEAP